MGPTNILFIYQRFLSCQRFTAMHDNITMKDDLDTRKQLHVIFGHISVLKRDPWFLAFVHTVDQSSAQDASGTCHV